jgi:hypothetical protein
MSIFGLPATAWVQLQPRCSTPRHGEFQLVSSPCPDLSDGLTLRDAYVFGTPIVCDPASLLSFNASILSPQSPQSQSHEARTNIWRVVNRGDAVATLLPSLGDKTSSGRVEKGTKRSQGPKGARKGGPLLGDEISWSNQLNYAHLGQLVKIESAPRFCTFGPGTLLPQSSPITVRMPSG